eukprot:GHVT01021183.1.p1 GENE.GHVT01021183.1~~GHVT01021183.1.p1  ORF type:complete len:161 (+),score=0.92 GHVT01021183.1:633-1115(+)
MQDPRELNQPANAHVEDEIKTYAAAVSKPYVAFLVVLGAVSIAGVTLGLIYAKSLPGLYCGFSAGEIPLNTQCLTLPQVWFLNHCIIHLTSTRTTTWGWCGGCIIVRRVGGPNGGLETEKGCFHMLASQSVLLTQRPSAKFRCCRRAIPQLGNNNRKEVT